MTIFADRCCPCGEVKAKKEYQEGGATSLPGGHLSPREEREITDNYSNKQILALLRKRHKVPSDNGKNPCIIAAPY